MDLNSGSTNHKLWLECECGFSGFINRPRSAPKSCPHCEPVTYQQLSLAPSSRSPIQDLPAGWDKLTPEQKARVERYIATLLAEQLRLL